MKRTLGCCFGLGLAIVSWFSQKQKSISLSLAKAEYMAMSQASCKAIWLCKILVGLFDQSLRPTMLYCDNKIYMQLMENLVFHD